MTHKFLKPGEFHITSKPMILETLVGSCVCVCLYNFKNGWAAMNHFLSDRPANKNDNNIGKYGSTSTRHVIDKLMSIDNALFHYRAMVFGGASVIKTVGLKSDIGSRNIDIALQILTDAHIRIIKMEISGKRGRRVTFNTEDGTVRWRFAGEIGKRPRGE
jgi:chemotaxis protein CheD